MTTEQVWAPCIQRSIQDFGRLTSTTRVEVLRLARGRSQGVTAPSFEALTWWRRLPGLPRHNRIVFAAIRDFRSDR